MTPVRVLRVFTNADGKYGNPLGVIEDGASIPEPERRQALAAELGFSESVFIDNADEAVIRIYSGKREVPFAGHAAVGAAWLLGQITGTVPDRIRTAAGDAETWEKDGATWVRSALSTTPAWWHERLATPEDVEALDGPLDLSQNMTQLWAWEDEGAGIMRVRTFAARAGIPEDEACGTGAMRMAAAFGRPLTVHHGKGSLIFANPGPPGYADIGGKVAEDETQTLTL